MKRTSGIAAVSIVALACGQVGGAPDAGSDGGGDAAWTQCSSPDGYQVCGAETSCPACPKGVGCYDSFVRVGLCGQPSNDLLKRPCEGGARDGELCVTYDATGLAFYSSPATIGKLLAQNNAKARVLFGDMSVYSLGTEVPLPTTCPSWSTAKACGGPCGTCDAGFNCVGRGPLHPVGWCKADDVLGCQAVVGADGGTARTCTDSGKSCLAYTVQPEAQPDADRWGACIPTAMCDELAKTLPGGAKCMK